MIDSVIAGGVKPTSEETDDRAERNRFDVRPRALCNRILHEDNGKEQDGEGKRYQQRDQHGRPPRAETF